jgi:hypothetical protein
VIIETLREELANQDRKLQQLSNEYERHLSELQTTIGDREREIFNINDKLRKSEQRFDVKQTKYCLNVFSIFLF